MLKTHLKGLSTLEIFLIIKMYTYFRFYWVRLFLRLLNKFSRASTFPVLYIACLSAKNLSNKNNCMPECLLVLTVF